LTNLDTEGARRRWRRGEAAKRRRRRRRRRCEEKEDEIPRDSFLDFLGKIVNLSHFARGGDAEGVRRRRRRSHLGNLGWRRL